MQEENLRQTYDHTVAEFFEKVGNVGRFYSQDSVEIVYRTFEVEDERGALVILPGRAEPIHKYAELVYDLRSLGFSLYLMSHRGQGESGKIEECRVQYVKDYDDYVQDLESFMQKVVNKNAHSNVFLLAHSMGAAIGTLYSLKHPDAFRALVLSAPMFDMNTPPFPKRMAYGLAKTMVKLGLGKRTGGKDKLQTTLSPVRKEMGDKILREYSKIRSEKISFGWAKASLDAIKKIQEADLSALPPVLMLQAGKDLHVPAQGQDAVCGKLRSCEKLTFPGSYHEILMERDSIRNSAMESVKKFLNEAISP